MKNAVSLAGAILSKPIVKYVDIVLLSCCGSADMRPWSLNREVPGSNLLAAAVVPLGKALYPHCLVLRKGLKALVPWLLAYERLAFLMVR